MSNNLIEWLKVGIVRSPYGVRGAFHVELLSDDVQRLTYLDEARFCDPKNPSNYLDVKLSLQGRKPETKVLTAFGIDNPETISLYRGWYIEVPRSKSRHLEADEYFICDLIGCAVFDQEHGKLGNVKQVLQSAAQDVFVVAAEAEADLLIPRAGGMIKEININERRIDVTLVAGLYELYRGETKS